MTDKLKVQFTTQPSMVKQTISWEQLSQILRLTGVLRPGEILSDVVVDSYGIKFGIDVR